MNFELTAEQRMLQATSRAWFTKHFQPGHMRQLLDGRLATGDPKELARAGYLGALVDPEADGGGLSLLELALICEEAGRVLADVSLVATAAYAVGILQHGNESAQSLLRKIATSGEVAAVVQVTGARLDRETKTMTAYCPDAMGAELATTLVVANVDRSEAWVALVRSDTDGVTRDTRRAIDPTRRIAQVRCDNAPAEVVSEGDVARRSIDSGRRKALVALAAEDLGAASACLERSIEYAKERRAFGRPIGSFQAIKHLCVDAYIAVEQLRTLVWYAAWCEDGEPASFPIAASAARAYAGETLQQCSETLIQVHGGVGVTWEHDAQLYWRRAQVDRVILGTPADHREVVARGALALTASRTDVSAESAGHASPSSRG
jgi:alkylation response protein AidB-like acyl-CoA dehydrogenase